MYTCFPILCTLQYCRVYPYPALKSEISILIVCLGREIDQINKFQHFADKSILILFSTEKNRQFKTIEFTQLRKIFVKYIFFNFSCEKIFNQIVHCIKIRKIKNKIFITEKKSLLQICLTVSSGGVEVTIYKQFLKCTL